MSHHTHRIIPSFTTKQLQEHYKHKDIKIIFIDSIKSAIERFDTLLDEDNMLLIAVKEKMEDNDYKIGVACIPIPISNMGEDYLAISLHDFTNIKEIFVSTKHKLYDLFKRITNNLSFI